MTLAIDNLALRCCAPCEVAREPANAQHLLETLLTAIQSSVIPSIGAGLRDLDEDPGIVFIDQLEFDLAINLNLPESEIGEQLARRLTTALYRKLTEPSLMRFKDRAELWGRFFIALAAGRAFTQAWHEEFAGLRLLPPSRVVRSLIEEQPTLALPALARLTATELRKVSAMLETADAERVLQALTSLPAAASHDPTRIEAALNRGEEWFYADAGGQLALLVTLYRDQGLRCDRFTLATHLRGRAAQGHASDGRVPVGAVADDRGDGAIRPGPASAGGPDHDDLTVTRRRDIATAPTETLSETRHGGIWLLLPHALQQVEGIKGAAERLAMALAAVAVSAGQSAPFIWNDPGLRALLGIRTDKAFRARAASALKWLAPRDSRAGVERTVLSAAASHRRDLRIATVAAACIVSPLPHRRRLAVLACQTLRAYAARLPGFTGASNAFLWKNVLRTSARVIVSPDGIRVELAPPDLGVILRISGADRATYTLPRGPQVSVGMP